MFRCQHVLIDWVRKGVGQGGCSERTEGKRRSSYATLLPQHGGGHHPEPTNTWSEGRRQTPHRVPAAVVSAQQHKRPETDTEQRIPAENTDKIGTETVNRPVPIRAHPSFDSWVHRAQYHSQTHAQRCLWSCCQKPIDAIPSPAA